jgi:hypothetical protein
MNPELDQAYAGLLAELAAAQERLKTAQPPLDESEMVEGHRWIFSLLAVALDVYVWADSARPRFTDIVGPYRKWGGDNADAFYQFAPIDPKRTYRVRVEPGDAVYLSLTVYGGPDDGRYSTRIVGSLNTRTMQRAADGAYELWLSPEKKPGNWLRLEGDAVCALTRDYIGHPDQGRRANWSIEAVDAPPVKVDDAATLAKRFGAARTWLHEQVQMCPIRVAPANNVQEPYPVPKETFGWAAGDASYAMGSFELADGQALLIEGRSPGCAFWNLCLWNPFLHTYDYAYDRVTLNGAQVKYEPDGSWKIWIAARDPGKPNWISTQGHARGLLWFRWFLPDEPVERPRATLIGADGKPVAARLPERPGAVRLEDLADPKFPLMMRPIVALVGTRGKGIVFEPAALMETASKRTNGLARWGNGGFDQRLDVLCRSLRNEANLADIGKLTAGEGIIAALRNRLLLEALYTQHPEIEDVPIAAPIVICGMPRTGTTHLFNLMSADPNLRYLPYWESLEPILPESERPAAGKKDPRIGRCAQACSFIDGLMPNFKRMHEMTVDHAHEEIQLLAMDVSGMLFETMAHIPSWRDAYLASDQTASYLYLKRVLKALTWLRGGKRWVLKSPQHLEQFGPLLTAFPDATLVITHRDPVAVTASMATMIAYSRRLSTAKPDVKALGRYWADRACDLLNGALAWRDKLPAERTIDVTLDEFMADESGTLRRIYAVAKQPLDAHSQSKMAEYSEAHPRGRHGTVVYDLEALGLDAGALREKMKPYSQRFGLRDEGLKS